MTLASWLTNNECDDEQRILFCIHLAKLLPKCLDGHLDPEQIDINENPISLVYNGNPRKIVEYSSPEDLREEKVSAFPSAVFSFGIILDELIRRVPYLTDKDWSTDEFLEQIDKSIPWFHPFDDDPMEDIILSCLKNDPAKRPQTINDLNNLILNNQEISTYIAKNNISFGENSQENNDTKVENSDSDSESNESQTEEEVDSGLAIGIDLGTSNSTVAYYHAGRVEIIGDRFIPSAIYFKEMDEDKWMYGSRALSRGVMYPDALFKHFKRHIGENAAQVFHCEPQGSAIDNKQRKYVIDTNIFIDDPYVIEGINEKDLIIIPKTVYEELGRRRSDPNTTEQADVAIDIIEKNMDRIIMEDSYLDLLPEDFFKSTDRNNNDRNDNKVLSVALHYNDKKTVLLSSDKALAQKATWLKAEFKVQNYKEFAHFRNITENTDSPGELKLTGKDGAVLFLKYLRNEVRKKIGYVNKAVITVPQKFSPIQRNEIKEAGLEAGFTDIILKTEPVAAAIAYGMEQKKDQTLLVYDFGGGTFDVTILQIKDGDFSTVGPGGGHPNLGGEDFTQVIIEDFKDKLLNGEILPDGDELDMTDEEASGLTHEEFIKNEFRIWKAAEQIKCSLSTIDEAKESMELSIAAGKRMTVEYRLNRDEFNDIAAELLSKARKALDETLQLAGLNREDIDMVIMAGGTSSIPIIADKVERYFGKKPYADRDPATLIAEGAALFADMEWNQNSTIDKQIKVFENTVTDLGVALKGHVFDCIIPINCALPVQKEKIYSLVKDNQEELRIECFTRNAGSNANKTLDESVPYIGQVYITNLPPLKRTEVEVAVLFRLTKEYELEVEVKLMDKNKNEIKQTTVKIDTIGV